MKSKLKPITLSQEEITCLKHKYLLGQFGMSLATFAALQRKSGKFFTDKWIKEGYINSKHELTEAGIAIAKASIPKEDQPQPEKLKEPQPAKVKKEVAPETKPATTGAVTLEVMLSRYKRVHKEYSAGRHELKGTETRMYRKLIKIAEATGMKEDQVKELVSQKQTA